ncbi:MAG: hypothetical protein IJE43_14705 [Alphaproteobacteria bacterium]|nr:hypothetical protein [Alphaproteobacteria bacterium]
MKINLQELRENLTDEHIISILTKLGAESYDDREDVIVFPTICHNCRENDASMKLYYYKDSHMFHCYTECNENFDIFDLIKRVREVNHEEYNFYNTIYSIADLVQYNIFNATSSENYISIIDKFKKDNEEINLIEYDSKVLDVFRWKPTIEWLEEGISENAMKKFNILYYDYKHRIVIPHYDIDGRLVGIRGRALDSVEAELYGKYAPLKVENTLYRHPLSFNLYGIWENKEDIKKYKTAIIFEGEKSVLKYNDLYDYNIAVASCGSNLNLKQVELLVKELGVENIIMAYDKEFESFASSEAENYYDKLTKLCQKYINYCNFYFLFDFNKLLELKESPIDKGKEVFEKLMKGKVQVKANNDL